MNKKIVYILPIILLLSCRKDADQPRFKECECEINEESENYFSEDVINLAVDLIRSDSTLLSYNSIIIPKETEYFLLGKLSAIYNTAKDTNSNLHDVIFKYKVHTTQDRQLDRIMITFTPEDLTVRNQFLNSPGETDNEKLNELVNTYGFNEVSEIWTGNDLYAKSVTDYNIFALVKPLPGTIGVVEAHTLNGKTILDPDIYVQSMNVYEDFVFEKNWENVFNGDLITHSWQIRVDRECNVSLVSEWGDDLPE